MRSSFYGPKLDLASWGAASCATVATFVSTLLGGPAERGLLAICFSRVSGWVWDVGCGVTSLDIAFKSTIYNLSQDFLSPWTGALINAACVERDGHTPG